MGKKFVAGMPREQAIVLLKETAGPVDAGEELRLGALLSDPVTRWQAEELITCAGGYRTMAMMLGRLEDGEPARQRPVPLVWNGKKLFRAGMRPDERARYLSQAWYCPGCGTPPEELVWGSYTTPSGLDGRRSSQSGWMTVCPRCQEPVAFFLTRVG
jgi:hypothetical protein